MAAETSQAAFPVNLRHCRDLSEGDLRNLPPGATHLWVGPSFHRSTTLSSIVRNLPRGLLGLDLDLTTAATAPGEVVAEASSEETGEGASDATGNSTGSKTDELVVTMTESFMELFRCNDHLRSLSLRCSPDDGISGSIGDRIAVAVADSLAKVAAAAEEEDTPPTEDHHPLHLELDLRECPLHDAGVEALATILVRLKSSPSPRCRIRSLLLGPTTALTPRGVRSLASALRSDRGHPVSSELELEHLDLSCSMAGTPVDRDDESARDLVSSLRLNSKLSDLSLFGCSSLGEEAGRQLVRCLRGDYDIGQCSNNGVFGHEWGCNTSLERINLRGTQVSPSDRNEIEYYLRLNRAGRRYLNTNAVGQVSLALWPYILAKYANSSNVDQKKMTPVEAAYRHPKDPTATASDTDVLYFFLRNKMDLCQSAR